MFTAAPMLYVSIVILQRDEQKVLRQLGQLGLMQLARTPPGPETAPFPAPDRRQQMTRCDRVLERVDALRRSCPASPSTSKSHSSTRLAFEKIEQRLDLLEERIGHILEQRESLLRRQQELAGVCEQIAGYQGLDFPLDPFERYSFLHFAVGSLPSANLQQLQKRIGDAAELIPLPEYNGRQPLIVVSTQRGRPSLEQSLEQSGFQKTKLPEREGASVDSFSLQGQSELNRLAAELKAVDAELRAMADQAAPLLEEIRDRATMEKGILEAAENFPRTREAVLLTGWVPASAAEAVKRRVNKLTRSRCTIEFVSPEDLPENQVVPVLLRHGSWLRPFEMLLSAYGLPNYGELEPTLFVAISFLLMFGMMFGDAGHGAVLGLIGLIVLFACRARKARDLGIMLLFAAVSSVCFGILYGSFFGLPEFKQHALWQDPLEGNPMACIYGALLFGILMISLGLLLNVINRFRHGDILGGLLDKFGIAGMVFYWGSLVLILKYPLLQSQRLILPAFLVFVAVPLLAWVLHEPWQYLLRSRRGEPRQAHEGMFSACADSLVGAFEAVLSYTANSLSFVRLAAYAMSHSALLVGTFLMADQLRPFAVVGSFASVLVIIFGNIVAIFLEGIIASVQALRLEYYEFFSKFFSGSGQAFNPFCFAGHPTIFSGSHLTSARPAH